MSPPADWTLTAWRRWRDLIKRLSEQGKIIFIVTHDFEFVCRTCSRVLHFDEGEMPDDIPVVMDFLPKIRELFSVSEGKEM